MKLNILNHQDKKLGHTFYYDVLYIGYDVNYKYFCNYLTVLKR
jgi:hypothetical protein